VRESTLPWVTLLDYNHFHAPYLIFVAPITSTFKLVVHGTIKLQYFVTKLVVNYGKYYYHRGAEELENMLDLESLRNSKVYLEGKQEGRLEQKLETVPILLELGLTIQQIAERLKLDVKTVEQSVKH
jgi:hypothetical protein